MKQNDISFHQPSLQLILDLIPLPVFFEDKKGIIFNCNMSFEKLVNTPRFYLLKPKGKFSRKIVKLCSIDIDDSNYLKVFSEEKRFNKRIFILTKAPYLSNNLEFIGRIGVLQDITNERKALEELKISELKVKESELLFRNLWDSSLDGFRLIDSNGKIVLVNNAYCDLIGKSKEDLIGSIFTIIYKDDNERILNNYIKRLKSNNIKEHSEDKLYLWNDKISWLESLNKIIKIKNKKYVLSIFRDITKRREMEEILQRQLNFETLIASINNNSLQSGFDDFDNTVNKNLSLLGNFFNFWFIGLFLIKGNRSELRNYWCISKDKKDDSFLVNNNVIANLKINKALKNDNIIIINPTDSENINSYPVIANYLKNLNIKILILVPLIHNNVFLGFIGIESDDSEVTNKYLTIPKLRTISANFINSIVSNKNYKFIEKEKEELNTILKSIVNGVITVNLSEVIVHANNAVNAILGLNNSPLIGINLRFLASKFLVNDSEYKQEALKFYSFITSLKPGNETFKLLTLDDKLKIVNISINELHNTKGEVNGYILIFGDITDKINIEKKLAFSQKMEAIGQLAAGIAHEINTPMQYINDNNKFLHSSLDAISSFVQKLLSSVNKSKDKNFHQYLNRLLEETELNFYMEESRSAISQSQVGIEKVISIIKAMKDFSHPGQTQKILTDINKCIDVTATISKNAWKYFAQLNFNLDPNLPLVFCNPQEINQVLINMIVNSAQAVEESIKKEIIKKGEITISTKVKGNFVLIEIEDNGIGIKKENLNKIFDMFFTTKEVGKGTGQGLSISYDIIKNKHNGNIEVSSKYLEGTKFSIYLPIKI